MTEIKVYIDGAFVPKSEAKISVYDRLYLYGDGCFEGIVVENGKPFKLDDHIDRLFHSMHALRIELGLTKNQVREAIIKTIIENNIKSGWMRVQVSRGVGTGADRAVEIKNPSMVIMVDHFSDTLPKVVLEKREKGLTAIVTSTRRIPPECLDPRIKTGDYLNMILASLERAEAGADAAIMLDTRGFVSEGPGFNVFVIKDGVLYTSPRHSALEGITRNTVIEIAEEMNMPTRECDLTTYDLYTADEVLATGSARGLLPIIRIDGRQIANGNRGPITEKLQQRYWAMLNE